jgi:hypothetical protein
MNRFFAQPKLPAVSSLTAFPAATMASTVLL